MAISDAREERPQRLIIKGIGEDQRG
jgi:hypothetical protein